ncbi:predicted protein [Chaetoceros tenuissimus]|uniref:Uncharacterized protein n=1 Tax=Chaetoceros tenuissimus TaxID=426638 RepID=A0AAD3H3J2_9STRA|nr:predicted protein [Chaetoceros tenuissimus]
MSSLVPSYFRLKSTTPKRKTIEENSMHKIHENNHSCPQNSSQNPLPSRDIPSIQSPSRVRMKEEDPTCKDNGEISTFYSPLSPLYDGEKYQWHIPNELSLRNSLDRWIFQSSICGSHAQPLHVLDLQNCSFDLVTSLKFGLTREMYKYITDIRISEDSFQSYGLPTLIDLMEHCFPNLEHFSIKKSHLRSRTTEQCKNHHSEIKAYNADGEDIIYSMKMDKETEELLDTFDSSIECMERDTEYMQRLYLIFRLPSLQSINGICISQKERDTASPAKKCKVPNYEWITKNQQDIMLSLVEGEKFCCDDYDDSDTEYTEPTCFEVALDGIVNYDETEEKSILLKTSSNEEVDDVSYTCSKTETRNEGNTVLTDITSSDKNIENCESRKKLESFFMNECKNSSYSEAPTELTDQAIISAEKILKLVEHKCSTRRKSRMKT